MAHAPLLSRRQLLQLTSLGGTALAAGALAGCSRGQPNVACQNRHDSRITTNLIEIDVEIVLPGCKITYPQCYFLQN